LPQNQAGEEASEASEWEEREREDRLADMRAEAERWGGEVGEAMFPDFFYHRFTGSKGTKGG